MDGGNDTVPAGTARSRLADYAALAGPPRAEAGTGPAASALERTRADTVLADGVEPPDAAAAGALPSATEPGNALPDRAPSSTFTPRVSAADEARLVAGRREFAALLGEFRRTAVLVPLVAGESHDGERVLTADLNGLRWIYAFSDEAALARFALARGEGGREWPYRRVWGARLLDVAVPLVGVPCGVVLDAGDGAEGGVLFPPVRGVVPDAVAVDVVGVRQQ